jgi:hypothetical protein
MYVGQDTATNVDVFTAPPEEVPYMPMPIPGLLNYPEAPAPPNFQMISLAVAGLSLLALLVPSRKRR